MKDPENFEAVRKLLALKRHEQPPPGYFNRLPGQIMARIEAGEARESWWEKITSALTLKPAVAYAFGLAFCGALVGGIWYSANVEPAQTASQPLQVEPWKTSQPVNLAVEPRAPVQQMASTNPVSNPSSDSLFNNIDVKVAPVSYDGN